MLRDFSDRVPTAQGPRSTLTIVTFVVLAIVAIAVVGAAWKEASPVQPAASVQPLEDASAPVADRRSKPRFDNAGIEAMKNQLLAEPKIKDVLFNPDPLSVTWQIGVADDGSSRVGYAGYVCLLLREKGLVDRETNVRIVDVYSSAARRGDFRGASLGHISCIDESDMGV